VREKKGEIMRENERERKREREREFTRVHNLPGKIKLKCRRHPTDSHNITRRGKK